MLEIHTNECIHTWLYAMTMADDIRGLRIVLFCSQCTEVRVVKVTE